MRVTLDKQPIGHTGDLLFHVAVYGEVEDHGSMYMVRAENMAKALYLAWSQEFDDTQAFDIERCDGYLIGHIERHL